MKPRPRSDGLRLTKVGLWFSVFLLIVLVAATNTGNNGLFLALAVLGGLFVVSHVVGRQNVRGLALRLRPPAEIFAQSPARLDLEITNRGRFWPRWLLVLGLDRRDFEPPLDRRGLAAAPLLVPYLGRRRQSHRSFELLLRRRGRHRLRRVHVTSLFPWGLFHKGLHHPAAAEILVFPEIFPSSSSWPPQAGKSGDEPTRRAGWGYDLFGLRSFRHGDDPRSIHWKQSARTGTLVWKEHEAEENRRLLILFDNAVGPLADGAEERRFERLVSEAATAALDYLTSGYEVALETREEAIPFASGARQRRRILETLALVEAAPAAARPLAAPVPEIPHLRLAMSAPAAEKEAA